MCLVSEVSDSDTIILAILNDEISENEFLDILHNSINENVVAWRLYRRSLSDLEFNMTEQEYERLVEEFKSFE